jgi:hypothetical protein
MSKGPMTENRLRHVNDHLTPLAVVVVVPGLFVVSLSKLVAILSVGLLAYAVIVNHASVAFFGRSPERVAKLRVVSNYVVNIALVWLLYAGWPAIWLLLLLMAVGPASYLRWRDALWTGIAVAAFLFVIHGLLGSQSMAAWASVGVEACAIVILSLFVSGLSAVSQAPSPP